MQVAALPRIVLMGLRRSGKTSIQKVVFDRTPPHNTTNQPSTSHEQRTAVCRSPFVQFQVMDLVGQIDYTTENRLHSILEGCGAIVFVIDCKSTVNEIDPFRDADFRQGVDRLVETVVQVAKLNSSISVEVFLHKVDALNEQQQVDLRRRTRDVSGEALKSRLEAPLLECMSVNYHLTSIYDHSVFEAFSHVVQKLLPQLSSLKALLDMFVSNSGVSQSFLFDVSSKIFVAKDTTRFDGKSYRLCSDALDLMKDFGENFSADSHNAEDVNDPKGSIVSGGDFGEIVLPNGSVMLVKILCRTLAVISIAKKEDFERLQPVIEYNVALFHQALVDMFGNSLKD